MRFADMRYSKIDGTSVSVTVTSAAEAKAALKELRHKKRELKFVRGTLVKAQRAARPKRGKKPRPPPTGLQTFMDDLRWGFSAMVEQRPAQPPAAKKPTQAEIDAQVQKIDETLHNIDGCILQLQGKLLTLG